MRSDEVRPDVTVTVIGVPNSRRVRDFVAAAERLGRRVEVIPYVDALPGRRRPEPGSLVRIESPGECATTAREILKAGIVPLETNGGTLLSASDVDRWTGRQGEIPPLRQWYFGFREILQRWEADWGGDVGWMSTPAAIVTSFDKAACLQRWARAGLPVPPRFPDIAGYAELRERVGGHHERLFIKLRYGYSAVGAVALEWRGKLVRAVTTVDADWSADRPRLFLSRRPQMLNAEVEIARLIDVLAREEMLVEAWLPKARWNGVPFDLRLVVIGGELRHVVGRANSSPFTNLNLDARRMSRESVEQRLGASWPAVQSLAERAAAEIPEALMLGIDLLVRSDRRRLAVLEANAFGDYLPGLLDCGESTYEAQLNAIGRSTGALIAS